LIELTLKIKELLNGLLLIVLN